VEKWKVQWLEDPRSTHSLWVFRSDGIMEMRDLFPAHTLNTTWRVQGDALVMGRLWNSALRPVLSYLRLVGQTD
jgi:hypothetical protein